MVSPPSFIDIRAASQASTTSSRPPLRSPRLHVAGEAPPELSPLDAFALQSRLLAKQLEESKSRTGRRVSRLPPLTTTSPLIVQARSDYFRSMSQDSAESESISPDQHSGVVHKTEVDLDQRPVSMHPRMSRIPPTPCDDVPVPPLSRKFTLDLDQHEDDAHQSPFGARRERSPSPMEDQSASQEPVSPTDTRQLTRAPSGDDSIPPQGSAPGVPSPERMSRQQTQNFDSLGLAPPRPSFRKRPSSVTSSVESADDVGMTAMASSFHSLPLRKPSGGTGSALPSPAFHHHFPRSPSIASEASIPLPRPSFNFSRPLSRAGTPGLDLITRQTSVESHSPLAAADEPSGTPVSLNSDTFENQDGTKAAPSYIYSKFTLPRGKGAQQQATQDPQPQPAFQWDPPLTQSNTFQALSRGAPPSPPLRPSSSSSKDFSLRGPSLDQAATVGPAPQPSPNPSRPSTEEGRSSDDAPRGRTLTSPIHDKMHIPTALSISTSDSASTIKAGRSPTSTTPSASEMTAEEHLAKGIKCHENGSLNESTYHLRLAAKQNIPTAMLLYALACRHGWGMRANEKEAVQWLRKAAASASVEIADDEDQVKEGKHVDVVQRKTRKAQFALSIYELGVSHLNGWGIEQDRALALRCFEIAGTWGDVDALAEAGHCYAQGIGCKKDLKKSAKFYRMAEAKGMSMVGNSWIHKAKYNDDKDDVDAKLKKTRSKSRTRALFGLKQNS